MFARAANWCEWPGPNILTGCRIGDRLLILTARRLLLRNGVEKRTNPINLSQTDFLEALADTGQTPGRQAQLPGCVIKDLSLRMQQYAVNIGQTARLWQRVETRR